MITPRNSPAPTGKDILRLGAFAGLAGVLLSPLRHYLGDIDTVNKVKNDRDSFPLSTYPMFSADRRGRVTVPHVVGLRADGQRVLPHYAHYGGGGLNQVRRQISRGIRQGRAVAIAQSYADSLAAKPRTAEEKEIVEVQVVRSRFIFDEYFAGDTLPQAESMHARCLVGGTAEAGPGRPLPRFDKQVKVQVKAERQVRVKEAA